MEELLKELGIEPEQSQKIIDGMKNKKIFTTAEENADIRLSKLQEDYDGKDGELTKANELIKQLQEGNKGNEDLQNKIKEYENEISTLKQEQEEKDVDNALKFALLSNKAKADDIDYLMFKIKSNLEDGKNFELDDKGNIKNLNIDDVKKQYKNNFEEEKQVKVDVKTLGGDKETNNDNAEPTTLLEALKENYITNSDSEI